MFLDTVPELRALVGEEASSALRAAHAEESKGDKDASKPAFKAAYGNLSRSDAAAAEAQVTALVERIEGKVEDERSVLDNLALRLNGQYPNDVGIFNIYFLNFMRLQPGQALFMSANEPHAYLSGDCIEVCSLSLSLFLLSLCLPFLD